MIDGLNIGVKTKKVKIKAVSFKKGDMFYISDPTLIGFSFSRVGECVYDESFAIREIT